MTMTMKDLADQAFDLREQRKKLAAQDKDLKEQLDQINLQIMQRLDAQGMTHCRTDGLSFAITETQVPTVENWDEVYAHIYNTGSFHLLERRMSSVAWRELFDHGELVPGTTPFMKRDVSMRRV